MAELKPEMTIQEMLHKLVTPDQWKQIQANYLKGMKKKEDRLAKQRIRSRKWREKKKAEMEAKKNAEKI